MTLRRLLLFATTLAVCALPAAAQSPHGNPTVFVKSQLNLTQYTGENSRPLMAGPCTSPVAFECDRQSYGAGFEVGIQATPSVGASVTYRTATYPSIGALSATPTSYAQNYRVRETVQVLTQYSFPDLFPRFTPYLQTGLHVTTGRTPVSSTLPPANGAPHTVDRWAFGPSFGAGLALSINHQLSVFAEATTSITFPDDAVDGSGSFFGTDRLSGVGFGMKVKNVPLPTWLLPARVRAPNILATSAPSTLTVDEAGLFTVESDVSSDVDAPTFQWEFSDGTTHYGDFVTKQFDEPGTYRVALRHADTNRDATEVMRTFRVRVRPPPVPTQIDSIRVAPDSTALRTPVSFHATTSGSTPIEYRWNLGDGTVAFTPEPTHTYTAPGTYDVTLEVFSPAGRTSHTRSVTVRDDETSAASDDESTYFVQLGAFSNRERAERFARRHAARLPASPVIYHDLTLDHHTVQLRFDTEQDAMRAVRRFRQTEPFAGAFLRTSPPNAPDYNVAAQ